MLTPDFSDRTYTAEIIRTASNPESTVKAIADLTRQHKEERELDEENGPDEIRILHRHVESDRAFHRSPPRAVIRDGSELIIPRTRSSGPRKTKILYDVFIAQCRNHVVVAVPFHELAESFFVRVDEALLGKKSVYEKLDITKIVINLGNEGLTKVPKLSNSIDEITLGITRCHLVYKDSENRSAKIQQARINGANLGATDEYRFLVNPVLKKDKNNTVSVTPVVLGFALSANEVKKSSATTDRHGNFKLFMGAGVRRLSRLFALLQAIESMKGVAQSTPNLPILQSNTIRDEEE